MVDITIDFGGTNIKIGLVKDEIILTKTSIPAHSGIGLLPRLPDVEQTVISMLNSQGFSLADCRGLGLAIPGIVDPDTKTLLSVNEKYADAVGFSFAQWAQEAFRLKVVMENDARAALLGEVAYGIARGEADAVMMIFGTGIGTAAIMNGRVVRGRHHQAGILGGHLTTDVRGPLCNCGNQGCLEAQASHWALPDLAMKHPRFPSSMLLEAEKIDYRSILESAQLGDAVAFELLDELIVQWSAGIINLIHVFDPEVVILSGGLMKSADMILPRIMERVHHLAWTRWGKVRFAVADDPETSVLLGLSFLLQDLPVLNGMDL